MHRYRIELRGNRRDLERLHRGFPSGDAYVIAEGSQFYLVAHQFDGEDDTRRVYQLACERANELSLAALLHARAAIGAIHFVAPDGQPRQIAYVEAVGNTTTSGFAEVRLLVDGIEQQSSTRAQRRRDVMRHNQHLKNALEIWCQRPRSWSQLHRILEEIEHVKRVVGAGWCSQSEYKRFTLTANSPHAAGIDARHADKNWAPPRRPMTLEDAKAFIERLLERAFDYEADRKC